MSESRTFKHSMPGWLDQQTCVSDTEISTVSLFGTKTLQWHEITRVSGSGYAIRLHNHDDDVTLAPSATHPQYEELVALIGQKCPRLFDWQNFSEMSTSWFSVLTMPVLGVFIVLAGIFIYIETSALFPLIVAALVGFAFVGITLASVQALTITTDALVVGYLYKERRLPAYEIEAITFECHRNKYGRRTADYYVDIKILQGGLIRIGNMRPGLPIVYHVLKNWHEKIYRATSREPST